jgi:DNA polymerase-4/DNA polymerase V
MTMHQIGTAIQTTIERELGITVSIGLAPTKVLAKVGSKHRKPRGLVEITEQNRIDILRTTPIGNIWGIGPRTAKKCIGHNILTALDFTAQPIDRIQTLFTRPTIELWHELNNRSLMPIITESDDQKSMTRSRTFHPATNDKKILLAELLHNLDRVLLRARNHHLFATAISLFIKTQDFDYHSAFTELEKPSAFPHELTEKIIAMLNECHSPRTLYRTTGITLTHLVSSTPRQNTLFSSNETEKQVRLYSAIDKLSKHHGIDTITTARRLTTNKKSPHK